MKVIKFLILLFMLTILAGCNSENNIINPEPEKGMQKTWIQLPKPANGLSTEMVFSKSQNINGNSGGEIIIDKNYYGGPHGEVKIIAKLKFPKGAFSGTRNITMTIDEVEGTVTYSPAMNFNKPAELYLKFEGMDIYGINPSQIDFVYFGKDGLFYTVNYKEIQVDIPSGILELKDGLIPHFSRYGWGR